MVQATTHTYPIACLKQKGHLIFKTMLYLNECKCIMAKY